MFGFWRWIEKRKKEREVRLIASGDVKFYIYDDQKGKNEKGEYIEKSLAVLSVTFLKNQIDTKREYRVHGQTFHKEYYFPRTKEYRHCQVWKDGGLLPDWAEDILQQKLKQ